LTQPLDRQLDVNHFVVAQQATMNGLFLNGERGFAPNQFGALTSSFTRRLLEQVWMKYARMFSTRRQKTPAYSAEVGIINAWLQAGILLHRVECICNCEKPEIRRFSLLDVVTDGGFLPEVPAVTPISISALESGLPNELLLKK
jgi:hypothetical protein